MTAGGPGLAGWASRTTWSRWRAPKPRARRPRAPARSRPRAVDRMWAVLEPDEPESEETVPTSRARRAESRSVAQPGRECAARATRVSSRTAPSSSASTPPGGSAAASARPTAGAGPPVAIERAAFQDRRRAPSKACAPGPRPSVGGGPVGQVVPAGVPGRAQLEISYQREAGGREALVGQLVQVGGAVLVLLRRGRVAPASRARAERQVVAGRAGQALGVGVVERQRVGREVVDGASASAAQRRRQAASGLARDVVQQVEADVARSRPGAASAPRRRCPPGRGAGPGAAARRRRGSGRRC